MRPEAAVLLRQWLERFSGPMLLDADALILVAEYGLQTLVAQGPGPRVLTPHPGEMARLLGTAKEQVIQDPARALAQAVELTRSTVVLKGATTLVAWPSELPGRRHHLPNDGLATAGSGDVLAGMIGGWLAQGMEAGNAACLGVYAHGQAGTLAARAHGSRGMIASDIIQKIPYAVQEIESA
jgi:NAD(P)H-hydrate epimerase